MEDIDRQIVSNEMKVYCFTKVCRRQFIAEQFGFEMTSVNNNCCDNCASICDANETLCAIRAANPQLKKIRIN